MARPSCWTQAACAALCIGTFQRESTAQSNGRSVPPRVQVTWVGVDEGDRSLDARVRSLFDPGTQVEFRRIARLTAGAVLKPADPEDLYLWILLKPDAHGRVYVAIREGAVTRYLFRDVVLETGLDEVGGETLSHIAHSSAMALWERQLESTQQKLEQELERDAKSFATAPEGSAAVAVESARPVAKARSFAEPVARLEPRSRPLDIALGVAFDFHHSGSLGWQPGPGGFLAIERRWSLRVFGSYLLPQQFEAGPARVRVHGAVLDLRAGWLWQASSQPSWRIRPEIGVGSTFLAWRAEAMPPATARSGMTHRSEYVVTSLTAELPMGPIWIGTRIELRVPFDKTSYDVSYAGQPVSVASAWLSPGIGIEIGIPLTRSSTQSTQ